MKKTIILYFLLLIIPSIAVAQFNFHWAFPYFAIQHMSVKNGNKDYLIVSRNPNYNGFPKVEQKSYWDKNSTFIYANATNKVKINSYIFMILDGTLSIEEVKMLHDKLPKNIVVFIHRLQNQWPQDAEIIKSMLLERPGWAYGGNPYDPKTPILRSGKDVFTRNGIILGNQAPGEGLK